MKFKRRYKDLTVSAIVARTPSGVIGSDGSIPWQGKLQGDQALFRLHTKGKAVIMGRKTWFSIPEKFRPLPSRLNIVITSDADLKLKGAITVNSIDSALAAVQHSVYSEAVFIGGERVYKEGLSYCNKLYLTTLEAIFPGDTHFPKVDYTDWFIKEEAYYPITDKRQIAFKFQILTSRLP